MSKNVRNWLILAIVAIVAFLAAVWAASSAQFPFNPFGRRPQPPFNPADIEFYYIAQTVVSTINVTLSVVLLLIYISIYRKTRSEFTLGLIIFSLVFLLNAVASDPLVVQAFGFTSLGLGPFALLPAIFTFAASVVLLYLSAKY